MSELTDLQARIVDEWAREICAKAEEIDPGGDLCWFSLFVGFAIGRGLSVEEATKYDFYYQHAFPKEFPEA